MTLAKLAPYYGFSRLPLSRYADQKAIVDESSARAAITEVTAE